MSNPNNYNNFPQGFPSSLNIGFVDYEATGTLLNGIPTKSPMYTNSTNQLDNISLQNMIQDGALSNVSFNTIQANVIKGGKLIGASLQVGTNFSVDFSGALIASNATINGSISATTGSIGGWVISSNALTSGDMFISSVSGMNFNGGVFAVDPSGNMVASSASITGAINATSGSISGNLTVSGTLHVPYNHVAIRFDPGASSSTFDMITSGSPLINSLQIIGGPFSGVGPTFTFGDTTVTNAFFVNINASHQSQVSCGSISASGLISGGSLAISGSKSAIEKNTSKGDILLYSVESPEVYYQDYGTARVHKGLVDIIIDPLFIEVSHVKDHFRVFLTAQGKCSYLYYKVTDENRFTILCDKDIDVDWMIVSHRRGYHDQEHRFKNIDIVDQS